MSAMIKPLIATFEANAAIAKGQAVMFVSANRLRVTKVTATTDMSIGIAQNAASAAGDLVEVALPGGGAKALAKTTISAGNLLGHNADASVQRAASANDRLIAVAMEDAVAGDMFGVQVIVGMATQTQS